MASVNSRSSGERVLICISKANNDFHKSFLYVSKLVIEDNRIELGNPVLLVEPKSRRDLWNNIDVGREGLRFGEIIKFQIVGNSYEYAGKTGKKIMDIDKIQMGLDFGVNSYRGILDACHEVKFVPSSSSKYWNDCYLHDKPEEDQIFIIAIASGTIFSESICLSTRNEERVILKLNCRENLTMSAGPLLLHVKKCKDEDVGDVAIIKFIESTSGPLRTRYIAVCEGLILRYKPKVISVEEEHVEIMNADDTFVDCSAVVTFDTGNAVATGISGNLVKDLRLEDKIDHTHRRRYAGIGRDQEGNPIFGECSTIKINIKIRETFFSVKALYNVTDENTDLLIGMDIINQLFDTGFTLGK